MACTNISLYGDFMVFFTNEISRFDFGVFFPLIELTGIAASPGGIVLASAFMVQHVYFAIKCPVAEIALICANCVWHCSSP